MQRSLRASTAPPPSRSPTLLAERARGWALSYVWAVAWCAWAAPRAMHRSPGLSAVLHHPAHVAHAAHAARDAGSGLLGRLGDDRFGHEDVLCDRGCVLQCRARDHGGVDDPGLDEVLEFVRVDVEAVAVGGLADVVDDD